METCSECGGKFQRINQHFALSSCGPDDGAKKTYTCDLEGCDETFEDYPSRLETRGRETFYCSRECQSEGQKDGEWVECDWCGSEVYKQASLLESMGDYSLDHHFCDKECEREWKRQNWVRQDHPNWKGGSGGINAVRNMLAQNSWFDTARGARDSMGDECHNCGAPGEIRSVDVHHIVPVAAGGTNGDWNLMPLCISCHRRAERFIDQYTTPHLYKFAE